jgi:hypothetical protein
VEKISEAGLKPAAALERSPFQLKGFRSDNGSEFINHQVAVMLQKLLIEQTKVAAAAFQRQQPGRSQARGGGEKAYGLSALSRSKPRRSSVFMQNS